MQLINSTVGSLYPPILSEQQNTINEDSVPIPSPAIPSLDAHFTFFGWCDLTILNLIPPGDVRFRVLEAATTVTAAELYIATSPGPPDGTLPMLTMVSKASVQSVTSVGPKGKSGSWSNNLPSGAWVWVGFRWTGTGTLRLASHRDRQLWSTAVIPNINPMAVDSTQWPAHGQPNVSAYFYYVA